MHIGIIYSSDLLFHRVACFNCIYILAKKQTVDAGIVGGVAGGVGGVIAIIVVVIIIVVSTYSITFMSSVHISVVCFYTCSTLPSI